MGVFKEKTTQSVPCSHGCAGDTFFISEFKSSPRSLVALPANPYCHGVTARLEQGDVDGPGEVVITWLGNSIQETTGVKPGLYRQLWAGTQPGSSG